MNLQSMFVVAKIINTYNNKLSKLLPPPLDQIKLAQIIDKKAIFIANNQSILNFSKQQSDKIVDVLTKELLLDIAIIEIKLNF